jgi:hypothetical protein
MERLKLLKEHWTYRYFYGTTTLLSTKTSLFESLPSDLLVTIIRLLPLSSIIILERVSKTCKHRLRHLNIIWKDYCCEYFDHQEIEPIITNLSNHIMSNGEYEWREVFWMLARKITNQYNGFGTLTAKSFSINGWILDRSVMIGLDGSGKSSRPMHISLSYFTAILYKWKLGTIVKTISTIGFNAETVAGMFVDLS